MNSKFADSLDAGLVQVDLVFEDVVLQKFAQFNDLVVEWNAKFNLTSITEAKESAEKHFIDSLLLAKVTDWNEVKKVCDVGSGAGFPGVPLKISFPLLQLTLLDSLKKRVGFLQYAIDDLGLEDIVAVHNRVEDFARDERYRDNFDVVVSRAVARLNVLLEFCLPLVKTGGKFLAMKGPDAEVEIKEAERALQILGGKVLNIYKFNLPFSGDQRIIIEVQKYRSTPNNYPRKPGIPAKKPL